MAKVTTSKIVEKGNFDLYIQKQIEGALSGDVIHVKGLVSVDLSMEQEVTNVAADDDPAYLSTTPPMTVTGTITILSMAYSDYAKIYNVHKDSHNIIWIGDNRVANKVGLAYKTTITKEDGTEISNMLSLPNATITLPSKSTTTRDEDGGEITNAEISVTATAYIYEDANGVRHRDTMGIANSETQSAIWDKIKDTIFVPDMSLPTEGGGA